MGQKEGKSVSLREIDKYLKAMNINFEMYGDRDALISGISSFENYQQDTVTWVKNINKYAKLKELAKEISPALIIIDKEVDKVSHYSNRLVCDNPKYYFSIIVKEFFGEKITAGIGRGSIIGERASISNHVFVGCNCVIEDDVTIGSGTKIYHNVIIRKGTVIGKNCVIKSGTVIGEEGYGYSVKGNEVVHIPHFGNVILEDEVEIGSNCSIDSGTMGSTFIGKRSKIDNLCHIAHNAKIGKNVMIVAGSIICGSVHVNDGVYIAPGAIIRNQIEIGGKSIIGMGSVVLNDTQRAKVLAGVPAKVLREADNEDL